MGRILKLIIVLLFSFTFLNSKKLKNYSFIYSYKNYSLGPIDGYRKCKIYIKNGKFDYLYNIESGKSYKNHTKYPEISIILDNINSKLKNYIVKYNSSKLPIKIFQKSGSFTIDISNYSFNNRLKSNNTLLKQYKDAYTLFKKSNLKNYKFIYQVGNRIEVKYSIEVEVKNGNTILAKESNTFTPISTNILDIEKIFTIAKSAIENKRIKRVIFDKKYGFINYLEYYNRYKKTTKIVIFNFKDLK